MDIQYYIFSDETHRKKEKNKTRNIKKTRWWQQKCADRTCYYCKKKFDFSELTIDHIIPIARGGKTAPGNVVPSCQECNKEKGVDTPLDLALRHLKNEGEL